jgi:hypothetical protein
MKKNLLNLLAVATIAVVSCQSEKEYFGSETIPGEVVNLQFSPVLPSGIKPLSSSGGGAAILDDASYDLRYILEVWTDEATPTFVERHFKIADEYETTPDVTFDVSLLAKAYKFVFWADFVEEDAGDVDLTYKTNNATGLKDIEWKATNYAIGSDLRDAYYGVEDVDLTGGEQPVNATLHRPFGKLRILATDLNSAITNDGVTTPSYAALTYTHTVTPTFYKGFNALTGAVGGATIDASGGHTFTPVFENVLTVGGNTYNDIYLLAFDYFFVPNDLSGVAFSIQLYDALDQPILTEAKVFSTVPVGVNKLTTVIGGLFTKYDADVAVVIDDNFEEEKTPLVTLALSDETIPATAEADGYEIGVSSSIGWTASVNAEAAAWCTLSATSGDDGPATVTVSMTEYLGTASRAATVTFQAGAKKKEVAVTQAAYATPGYAATTQVWTFGTSPLVWSDYIATGVGGTQVVPALSGDALSDTDPQYTARVVGAETYYYYNWEYMNTNKATICPSPWRVPAATDFEALMTAAGSHNTLNAAWTGQGWRDAWAWSDDGYTQIWTSEDQAAPKRFYSLSWGFAVYGTGKVSSLGIRCVR